MYNMFLKDKKMSNKIKAALITAAMLAIGAGAGLAIDFIARNVDFQTILNVFMFGVCGFIIYTLYTIILGRLNYEDKVSNISKNG
jgi:hypothetical protein